MPPTQRHRKETHRELIVGLLTEGSQQRAADFVRPAAGAAAAAAAAAGLRDAT